MILPQFHLRHGYFQPRLSASHPHWKAPSPGNNREKEPPFSLTAFYSITTTPFFFSESSFPSPRSSRPTQQLERGTKKGERKITRILTDCTASGSSSSSLHPLLPDWPTGAKAAASIAYGVFFLRSLSVVGEAAAEAAAAVSCIRSSC